jgi:hypothetical protein
MKGTYRPSSAPLGKTPTKSLFRKQDSGAFFEDMLVANALDTPAPDDERFTANGDESMPKRSRSRSRTRQAKQARSRKSPSPARYDDVDAGIVEYGDDAYVIEDEEEAIHRIQTAMISAVARGASPKGRKRNLQDEEEHFKKIGEDFFISGNCSDWVLFYFSSLYSQLFYF